MMLGRSRVPRPKYTVVGETLRHVIPSHLQCSVACGGRSCKYEDPSRWDEDMQAVQGLYSSWITDELLAMARPSTEIIEKYNIIEQFQRFGIKTVINLQHPGEHASCGNELEPESGFTYRPEAFMDAGIYYYNYGWKDYGVASLTTVLDMVKVMSFAVQEGNVAVHCHAGLGRTGVLLACYLVFTTNMNADQAIVFVRAKRPNSIQTRGQLLCVRQFAQFLVPLRSVFSRSEPAAPAITLSQFLIRQQHLLHGLEARRLRHTPKIVQLVCQLLLDIAEKRQVVQEEVLDVMEPAAEDKAGASPLAARRRYREAVGRGLVSPQRSLPGPATVPLRKAEPLLFYVRRSLSYSDSDHGRPRGPLGAPDTPDTAGARALKRLCVSHHDLRDGDPPASPRAGPEPASSADSLPDSSVSVWDHVPSPRAAGGLKDRAGGGSSPGGRGGGQEEARASDVPFILIQTELTLEARRLLVSQALAVDLEQDGEEEQRQRVSGWQTELNTGAAVWDSLCAERDPFVLSGLMWSWLEQLKEPVLNLRDIQALEDQEPDASRVLNTLEKGPQQTLTCILDCAAQVMKPSVESAFLNRIIKAFTKMKAGGSEQGRFMYKTMRRILTAVLREIKEVKATVL
ncbi:protein tyrosine phosphatase domain-containing protein 1-like [Conger conger]|uniref:protein tyrosine phosphatase domain-containing protein 1-like n=1 Tax=Conger conger TaxID=82655 RepID=UPI002A5AA16C|nr:protein tyrosine phosphatase domain-containing protein 1-like [Conger conger]